MRKISSLFDSKFGWLWLMFVLIAINWLASSWHTRLDLTEEKRYTLSRATDKLVRGLDEEMEINVFLKGEFPSGFRKLANSTSEFLQLLKDKNGSKISYHFISPEDEMPGTQVTY